MVLANTTLTALPHWMMLASPLLNSSTDAVTSLFATGWTWISVAAATVAVLAVHRLVTTLVLHPLASVPGPWYAAVSDAWLTSHVLRLEQCRTIHELFDKYGPVVRVGPNKVVFCDLEATKLIYNVHKFDKGEWYKSLKTNDNDHAMTTLDHAGYVIRRKAYAPHYLPSNLARFQPEIREFVLEVVDAGRRIGGKQTIDTLPLFRQLMVDIMSISLFGYHIGATAQWNIGNEHWLCTAIGDFPKRSVIKAVLPTFLFSLASSIPRPRLKEFFQSDAIVSKFVTERVSEIRGKRASFDPSSSNGDADEELAHNFNAADFSQDVWGEAADKTRIPIVERLLQYKYPGNIEMPECDIASEVIGHTIAGVDTTSMALSYFLYACTTHPEIHSKLQAEIDNVMPDSRVLPELHVLLKLPYLNAFVKEGLRVYGPAPALLERVVPASTTTRAGTTSSGYELLGYGLPAGTVVATQAWSLHRDSSIYPSPEEFNPERWLTSTPEQLSQMERALMPFGSGSRLCGGFNLANVMLRTVMCAMIRNFEITAPAWTNEKSMTIKDSFIIFPAGMKCDLILTPRTL